MARNLSKTSLKLFTLAIIKQTTTLGIAPSYKTGHILNNYYVNDCKLRG